MRKLAYADMKCAIRTSIPPHLGTGFLRRNSSSSSPICATAFRSRLRLLAHLMDRRRPRCSGEILNRGIQKLPVDVVQRLGEADGVAKLAARRAWYSQVIACNPAITAADKFMGHDQS